MNNFDTSSNGVNLELSCFFDISQGQYLFNENFVNVYRSGSSLLNDHYFNIDCFLFIDYGNCSNDFDLADFDNYSFTKNDLFKALVDHDGDLIALRDSFISYMGYSIYKATKADLLDYVNHRLYDDSEKIEFCSKYLTPKFEVLPIRGHSQGDYAEIIFKHCDIEQYNFEDREKFLYMMQDHFTNLFYNAPLFCRLTINDDVEINLHGCLKNEYEYDKSEILDQAKQMVKHENKEYILKWLDENLPDQPDYN